MSQRKYIEPHPLKAKLLAWSEFNTNEIDMLISVFKAQPVHEVYKYFLFMHVTYNPKISFIITF